MHKKLILSILLVLLVQGQILLVDPAIRNVVIKATQEAQVYSGNIQVNLQGGQNSRIDFFATLVPYQNGCAHSKCYSGWVDNYTIRGDATIIGYGNADLPLQPVFQFKTNSQKDFLIVRNSKLDETWVQIIEIICEKVNPQTTQKTPYTAYATTANLEVEATKSTVDATKLKTSFLTAQTDFATSSLILSPEQEVDVPKYSFQTVQEADLKLNTFSFVGSTSRLSSGDKIARLAESVPIQGFKTTKSGISQTLVLNTDNLVKIRAIEYNLNLASDFGNSTAGEKTQGLTGLVNLNFNLAQKTRQSVSKVQAARKLLSQTSSSYNLNLINKNRADLGQRLNPEIRLIIDEGPSFQDSDVVFVNQKSSGINVVDSFKAASTTTSTTLSASKKLSATSFETIATTNLRQATNPRLLQVLQNHTIYNYKKTLFSKTILGKTFKAEVQVKCYMLVLPSDHQIQCVGSFNYELFGKTKSVQIFNFIKSISFAWNWTKHYEGTWGFSVYVPLPPPVSFLGITFSFNIKYIIDVSINAFTSGTNPYIINVNALASTEVITNAKAGLRALVIQGGVFIKGTLVKVTTDPKVSLAYYFTQKKTVITTIWYFWINAFQYQWGFYYRTWKLFSGWSGQKVIAQWNINGVYGKWAIVNKSWTIYF